MNKPSFKDRFRYWFDNRMSKGSISLIRFLVVFSVIFVLGMTGIAMLFRFNDEQEAAGIIWDGFSTIINAWMPSYEDGSIGYLFVMAIIAVAGLLVTSVLIGIVTSAMEEKIMNLKRGNSIVIEKDHTIILGFFPGEYTLISQLILAAGSKPAVIVVGGMLEKEEMETHIHDNVEIPKNVKVVCRTVDLFDPASIEKLSVDSCSKIVISPMDDNSTIKTLLAVSALITDSSNKHVRVSAITSRNETRFPPTIARRHNVTTLQTNDTLARIIAHSCTQTGLSEVFKEVFNFEGSELYNITLPDIEGMTFADLMYKLDKAVPIGVYREFKMKTNPPQDLVLQNTDKILVFSEERDSAVLLKDRIPDEINAEEPPIKPERDTRVLVFGQNETLVTVLYELPENVQSVTLVNYDGDDVIELRQVCNKRDMSLTCIKTKTRNEIDLLNTVKNAEHVILLSSHEKDEETADMDTIFLLLNLREIRTKYRLRFNITTEMRREVNQRLVESDDHTDFIVASNMSSLFLAQLAESPELVHTFRELLSNEGNELYMKRAGNLNCVGEFTVSQLRQKLFNKGYIFLGYMTADNNYSFNPDLTDKVTLKKADSLIVLGLN